MVPTGDASGGRRAVAVVVSGLLAIALIAGILIASGMVGGGTHVVTVKSLSGSEKIPFFQDARVIKRLRKLGFDVQVESAGSREIATNYDLTKYDFGFPAGVPAAEKIRREIKTPAPYTTFFTPMVVASFRPIAELLVKDGMARRKGSYYLLDMKKYMQVVA